MRRADPLALPRPDVHGRARLPGRGSDRPSGGPRRAASPDAAAPGRLPAASCRRLRRHGGRVRGDPGIAGPARGLEDAPLPPAQRSDPAGAIPARGPRRGPVASHPHRAGLRRRRARRLPLLHHAVHPGARAGRRPGRGQAAAARAERSCRRRGAGVPRLINDPRARSLQRPLPRRRGGERRIDGRRHIATRSRAGAGPGEHGDAPGGSRRSIGAVRPARGPVPPRRGADRHRCRRGPGVRPQPGRPPPRYQALQPHARRPGTGLDHRLRPGQGPGQRSPDAHRRHRRHAAVHGAGAVQRLVRPAQRRLRPGGDPV